jgi:hypothetical protein
VLTILDRVRKPQQVEGNCVELKTKLPEPKDAARSIAAMCNAAGGEPVLLLVGVNEKAAEVPGAPVEEVADWWPQVQREFDQDIPAMRVLPVHVEEVTVVALLFDSHRAPFVVRNPPYGHPGSRHVSFELPWREGNSTRTARREHLIRMAAPAAGMPELELLDGRVTYNRFNPQAWKLEVNLEIFASLRRSCTLVGHRTRLAFIPEHLGPKPGTVLDRRFKRELFSPIGPERAITLHQPSSFGFYAVSYSACLGPILPPQLQLGIDFALDGTDRAVPLELKLIQQPQNDGSVAYVRQL